MLTEEQKAAYLAKFEAEKAHRRGLLDRLEEADSRGDRTNFMVILDEMNEYDESLYPCEHGRSIWEDCYACEAIHREVYGLPPLEEDEDAEEGGPIG